MGFPLQTYNCNFNSTLLTKFFPKRSHFFDVSSYEICTYTMLSSSRKTHNVMKIQLVRFNDYVRGATENVVLKKKEVISSFIRLHFN